MDGTESNHYSSDDQNNNQTIIQNQTNKNQNYDSLKSKSTKKSAHINLEKATKK